ncbi:uncharacterized protein LOC114520116 [Dendronephthya gigantea]|uniref:uncharacterized protein LOC114520116 n=1 Tax=Dendronephthya gigantea TaxID=151771 RepID=UPI00106A0016|nr:uncharacterized protein LOC114520116 [Dendronephthya gigantea]
MSFLSSFCLCIFLTAVHEGESSFQASYRKHKGRYLANHVFRKEEAKYEHDCATYCIRDELCASVNYKVSGESKGLCELNSKPLHDDTKKETYNVEFNHLAIVKKDCPEVGQVFSTETKLCTRSPSCNELLLQNGRLPDGRYTMQLNTSESPYTAYCHMSDISNCGGGGWTLVLKVDGVQSTFTYESPYWTNKESYAVEDGLEGLTEKESKLASYWNTPFKKICLGMTVNGDRRWMVLNYEASSLYSVIAGNQFQRTSAGKDSWKSLIAGSLLQKNCNTEGFNVNFQSHDSSLKTHVRFGFVANNEHDCLSCDSWVGFGVNFVGCDTSESKSCGNRAVCAADKVVDIQAFGYILVQ